MEGFVVPRADEHLGEYVPPSAERLAWLTGFTGSAGLAIVLQTEAAAFTDGRYILQMAAETDGSAFERLHMIEQPPQDWAAKRARRLGYDPWLLSDEAVARYTDAGLEMVPLSPNPVDTVWEDRPPPPVTPATPQPLVFSGKSAAEKSHELAETLRTAGQDACVLTDPASIGWLLNLRGGDIPFVPVSLAFAILHADARVDLFIDAAKLSNSTRDWLGDGVQCRPPGALAAGLAALAGRRVRVDSAGAPAAVAQTLRAAGAAVVAGSDPCLLPKAAKNPIEQEGARAAHRRDAVAMCRFLHWLDHAARRDRDVGRSEVCWNSGRPVQGFKGESFPAITGAGEHGAVIHYRVSPQTDRVDRPQ